MKTLVTTDRHPAIMIKPCVLARSGVYHYTYAEMVKRGFTPKEVKPLYSEYRPPHVLVKNKDKFAFATMTVEHTEEETTPENFRDQTSGIVGDTIEVTALENDEVALQGNMAFYTKDAVEYFNAGNKETSADYTSKVVVDKTGKYDFVMVDIVDVNGVVITAQGRGGPSVRVLDSIANPKTNSGGLKMKRNVLSIFGIGRSKDKAEFKLSQVLMDGVKKVHTTDAAGISKMVEDVLGYITPLSESNERDILIGAVHDSFSHPVEVIAKEAEVSTFVDKLYTRCRDADEAATKKTVDEAMKDCNTSTKDADEKEKAAEALEKKAKENLEEAEDLEKESTTTKDSMTPEAIQAAVQAGIEAGMKRVTDSLPLTIEAQVKAALGLSTDKKDQKQTDTRTTDSGTDVDADASFLLKGVFGQ